MNDTEFKKFLKSPQLILSYLIGSHREIKTCFPSRNPSEGFSLLSVECPSKQCHDMIKENPIKGGYFTGAQIIVERGTGIARVHCPTCGGSWDIFGLWQYDKGYDSRNDAIHEVVTMFSDLLDDDYKPNDKRTKHQPTRKKGKRKKR